MFVLYAACSQKGSFHSRGLEGGGGEWWIRPIVSEFSGSAPAACRSVCPGLYLVLFKSRRRIFSFASGYFARLSFFLFNVTARLWTCCDAMLFPGIPDPLSVTLGGGDVPLVFSFIRRDNLAAWGKFFVNLYELKPRIWFSKEYIHSERIYRVCRFDGFSSQFISQFIDHRK